MIGEVLGLAAASIPELLKTINGVDQIIKSNNINPVRPLYKVPGAVNEATNTARARYYDSSLPNEDYITGKIGASSAQAIRAAKESGRTTAEILQAAAGAQANHNEAIMNLAIEGGRREDANANAMYGQLDNLGQYQDKADDYNQRQPYAEQAAAKSALIEGGNQNLYGGITGLAKVAATATNDGTTKTAVGKGVNPYLSTPQQNTATTTNPDGTTSPTSPDNSQYGLQNLSSTELFQLMNKAKMFPKGEMGGLK